MADNEGIRSSFPTQPSARSPKLRRACSCLTRASITSSPSRTAWRSSPLPRRRNWSPPSSRSKKSAAARDPDDVYVDVERREEERKRHGLPPSVIATILPHSAVARAGERWEAEQERNAAREKSHD